jgi:dihydrofolate reductase
MKIISRLAISTDGYVTTPDGWPALLADPGAKPGQSHGVVEFLKDKEAALMGASTFALTENAPRWPWPNLDVFVLGAQRPAWTPDHVTYDADPAALLEQMRARNRGGDVHLVGGPKTVETYRKLGALHELQLVVLPVLIGAGLRLTPDLSTDAGLTIVRSRALPEGAVEIVYEVA